MTILKNCASLSWVEIKTLHRLVTSSGPLKCCGSYWTHDSDPQFAIALDTIKSLSELGWIEPGRREGEGEVDDWVITSKGKSVWEEGVRAEFYSRVDRHIDTRIEEIDRKVAARKKAEDERFERGCVYLGDRKGIWIPHR